MNNAFLRSITSRDLNQRYGNTYFLYKNKPIFCQQIVERVPDGHIMAYIPVNDRELARADAIQEEVEVREISIERPRAGFYITASGTAFYFSYRPRKIYSRGLVPSGMAIRDGNCMFQFVGIDHRNTGNALTMMAIRAVLLNTTTSHRQLDYQEILNHITRSHHPVILRHHFCIAPDMRTPGLTSIRYRSRSIGQIDNDSKKIMLISKKLVPEFLEVVKGIDKKDIIL